MHLRKVEMKLATAAQMHHQDSKKGLSSPSAHLNHPCSCTSALTLLFYFSLNFFGWFLLQDFRPTSVAAKQRKLIISTVIPNALSCICGSHAAAQTGCVGAAEEGVLLQKARVPSPASQTLTLSKVAPLGREGGLIFPSLQEECHCWIVECFHLLPAALMLLRTADRKERRDRRWKGAILNGPVAIINWYHRHTMIPLWWYDDDFGMPKSSASNSTRVYVKWLCCAKMRSILADGVKFVIAMQPKTMAAVHFIYRFLLIL